MVPESYDPHNNGASFAKAYSQSMFKVSAFRVGASYPTILLIRHGIYLCSHGYAVYKRFFIPINKGSK